MLSEEKLGLIKAAHDYGDSIWRRTSINDSDVLARLPKKDTEILEPLKER